ncbi:GDP-mannose 4,6-dehydratase [Candidatus Woesearchaeota archaeon]|nr:GDP-mannose 4,6-dehydratase [Candidatus Woesearchaeota archaeon]
MNVLVTGGAGFIGSHVCEALLNRGDFVICVDDFNDYYEPKIKKENIKNCLKNSKFKLYAYDIRNLDDLRKIFNENKIDRIVHLAGRVGVRNSIKDPLLYESTNVHGTLNLLELAREFKTGNFVFGSSSSVYGANKKVPFNESDSTDNVISPYAATKKAGELLCKVYSRLYGLKIICLRLFTVYGPRGRPDMIPYNFTKLVSDNKEIKKYGNGTSKRDYTYITDVVDGILKALDSDSDFEIINFGNSNAVELNYFISLIEKNLGKKAKIKPMEEQPGDMLVTYADISKAKKLLGWEPKIRIEEGMKKMAEWLKENEKKN